MPSRNGQGQSHATEDKARGFKSIFETNLRVSKIVFDRTPFPCRYFHFDLHGGSGFNDEVGVIGSPVLFAELAQQEGVPFRMHVAEIDKQRAGQLSHRLANVDNAYVHTGDNRELAAMIPDVIRDCRANPEYAIGSVVVDPNGMKNGVPWDELSRSLAQCPRIDIVINYAALGVKRAAGAGYTDRLVLIDELPKVFSKKFWLIRKPVSKWQFTMVVGRNVRLSGHRGINLYDWDSPDGRDCLREAKLTSAELKARHKTLF